MAGDEVGLNKLVVDGSLTMSEALAEAVPPPLSAMEYVKLAVPVYPLVGMKVTVFALAS